MKAVSDFGWGRWGAYAGLAFVVLQVLGPVPIFLGGAPPEPPTVDYLAVHRINFESTDWITSLALVAFMPFLASLRQLIRSAGGDWDWPAGVAFAAGVSWAVIRLLHNGLLVGAVMDATDKGEPIVIKALTEAAYGVGFTFGWLFAALFIVTASYAAHRGKLLPGWIVWFGYLVAALNFVTSLALFGGGNGTAVGVVNILIGLLPLVVWTASVSIAMLRPPKLDQGGM
jgi:hypothetical protein